MSSPAVSYLDYYSRLLKAFASNLFRLGGPQVIGALLAVAILVLQLRSGVMSATVARQAWASIFWPYALLILILVLLSALRAPVEVDRDRHTEIREQAEKIDNLSREKSRLEEAQKKPELSQQGIEILLAAYEGLPTFGNVMISSSMNNTDFVIAGHIEFSCSDPIESARYSEAVESLVAGRWLKRLAQEYINTPCYVPSAKGLYQAKEALDSPEGRAMMAELNRRFPPPK